VSGNLFAIVSGDGNVFRTGGGAGHGLGEIAEVNHASIGDIAQHLAK